MAEPTERGIADVFFWQDERCDLTLLGNKFSFQLSPKPDQPPSKPGHEIPLEDIIIIRPLQVQDYFSENRSITTINGHDITNINGFEIDYLKKEKDKLKLRTEMFHCRSCKVISKLVQTLQIKLQEYWQRPKKVLVFINPFGGKHQADAIYRNKVAPIFKRAGIETREVTTEREGHAYDKIIEEGWGNSDAIVVVGGDGTLNEVVSGVVKRTATKQNLDLDKVALPLPDIRIGVVPAGSTDTVAYSLHDTSDVETAVLCIVMGDIIGLDICSVHHTGQYINCFLSLMSYGYLGDVIKDSSKLRWMGPLRYECAGAWNFCSRQRYEGDVWYQFKEEQRKIIPGACTKNNCYCVSSKKLEKMDEAFSLLHGEYFMVTAANLSCSCDRSPNGISPLSHCSDGYFTLVVIRRLSLWGKVRLLLTLSSKTRTIRDLDFVDVYKTRCIKFQTGYGSGVVPATRTSAWNLDGELLRDIEVTIRCHQRVIKMFCRRKTN